jgi:hypothetical protein
MIENTPDSAEVGGEHDRWPNDASSSGSRSINRHRPYGYTKGEQLPMFDEGTEAEGHTRVLERLVELLEEKENEGVVRLAAKLEDLESRVEGITPQLHELRDVVAAATNAAGRFSTCSA